MLISYLPLGARALLGLILAVSLIHKLRGPRAFAASLAGLRLLSKKKAPMLAAVVIGAEAVVCAALTHPAGYRIGLPAAAALMAGYAGAIGVVLRRGTQTPCACFGSPSDRPLSRLQLARNLVLFAAACAGTLAAFAPAQTAVRLEGAALTLLAAALLTVVVVRLDDIVELFAPWPGPSRHGPPSQR
ncbi:hypothetical protein Rhe02_08410 [Rhizocola hellebori]|uniref:Methylamine utilisation protein MauE domain-containing protein n=1 Tax=Rhizocola hellebori TaxID=1392758 RepID=A0A8J3Q2Z7_9ACTN|nr:MauE/DoxX family redox-associated membrane protein [Rhizocola hellebori]GIH02774.1 hypothetical protein Rhe02_08410 [Rhizocola hellebori]